MDKKPPSINDAQNLAQYSPISSKSLLIRSWYFFLGWVFFSLGAIGVILPVLPTTPFMLLALWAFSQSSQRFHRWLYNHPFFGPPIQLYRQYRVIPLTAKLMALAVMLLSLGYIVFYTQSTLWVNLVIAGLMAYGAWFILTKPSRPPR